MCVVAAVDIADIVVLVLAVCVVSAVDIVVSVLLELVS
jgi:hypothetical protein